MDGGQASAESLFSSSIYERLSPQHAFQIESDHRHRRGVRYRRRGCAALRGRGRIGCAGRSHAREALAGRTREKLDRLARDLDPTRTLVHTFDASKFEEAQQLINATIARFGRIDVLVNNADVAPTRRIDEASLDDWRALMSTDLDGVFYCTRAAIRHLIDARGSIVNVSSVSGLGRDWGMSFYNAAKGAVTNFTRALAMDHGRDGVRVNAVCPSLTETDLTKEMLGDQQLMAGFRERIPLGRAAKPDDIAAVIAFLASEAARFVTEVNLPVDGGLSASNGQPPQA